MLNRNIWIVAPFASQMKQYLNGKKTHTINLPCIYGEQRGQGT